jgi:hypothetical protein
MRGLMPEPDISYTKFATELGIDPSYLRRVLKRLGIEGHQDPTNKSRKLLTADQQQRTRDALKRDNTGTLNKLTEYLDIPLTQALAQSFGAKLEQLTAIDKLDAAQAILTAIAWGTSSKPTNRSPPRWKNSARSIPMPRTPTPSPRSSMPIVPRSKTV